MVNPAVTVCRLRGHRNVVGDARRLAPAATALVAGAVPGRMPPVEITVTGPRGLAELAVAAEVALAGGAAPELRADALRDHGRLARSAAGCAVALPGGGVRILLVGRAHRGIEDVAATLVHELVHAMQFSRPGVRQRIVRDLRDAYGVAPQSPQAAREHLRLIDEEEAEAYAAERLASQLFPLPA
ncbi:hypothetical protein ACFU99_35975 [Streptomyces sp. NPDC057654]|uniref:hypothetical protein n=1 Tax=Streptomyces sp. NPDC057654 TaxID=3346196 RepID=UPI0036C9690F